MTSGQCYDLDEKSNIRVLREILLSLKIVYLVQISVLESLSCLRRLTIALLLLLFASQISPLIDENQDDKIQQRELSREW